MIWIDTDLIIPPDALVRLVKMSSAGMPIAAGIYRRAMLDKDHQFLLTRRTIDEWATLEELRAHVDGGVTRVSMSAGGFSIVRREVYVRRSNGHSGVRGIWSTTARRMTGVSEDTYFMRRVRKLDIPSTLTPNCTPSTGSTSGRFR